MQLKEGLFLVAYRTGVSANEGDRCPYHVKPLSRAWRRGSKDVEAGLVMREGVLKDDDAFVRDRLHTEFQDTEFWANMFRQEALA